jgi:pimeloyl-ACP methyl ester carboxylesterase
VIAGDEDKLSTTADAQAMADALATSQLVYLAGSGHLTAVERPDDFNSALREFLAAI